MLVSRFAAILLLASGCFYTDPINQRPSIAIHQTVAGSAFRGQIINFEAISSDPDGYTIAYQWRAYACTDEASCDSSPFDSSITKLAHFTVPMSRAESTMPIGAVYVTLEAKDDFGATAKPSQELFVAIEDRAPELEVRKSPRHAYVVNTPVELFAKVGDVDDTPSKLAPLVWDVQSPATQPGFTLDDMAVMQDPNDPAHLQYGKLFTPAGTGDWTIQVTAEDPTGLTATAPIAITVVPDHAPCLAQWDPAASQQAAQLIPITDPTLFQVLIVADDLDPFPSVPDGIIGQTEFHWSIVPPGGSRTPLAGVTGSGVALDPASYIPGDIVELRVEIQDRNHITVNCPDAQLACSVISDPTCNQRLTWRVEMQ